MPKKLSQNEELEVCRFYKEEGLTQEEVAKQFGIGHSSVGNILKRQGVNSRSAAQSKQKLSDEDEVKLCQLYKNQEYTYDQLAEEFEISRTSVPNILERRGIQKRSIQEANKKSASRRREKMVKVLNTDKTGEVIDQLAIIGLAGWKEIKSKPGSHIAVWKCLCKCGNTCEINNNNWNSAKTVRRNQKENNQPIAPYHCNNHPHHFSDTRIGDKLGYLEVVDLPRNQGQKNISGVDNRAKLEQKFLIACTCTAPNCLRYSKENPLLFTKRSWEGRKERQEESLGFKSNCGCINPSQTHGMSSKNGDPKDYRLHIMVGSSKQRAKKDGIPHDIDAPYLKSLGAPDTCPVLGITLNYKNEETQDDSPSIDKFYPSKGYVRGNVQIISYRANRIKSDGTPEEWGKIAEWCKKEDIRLKLQGKHSDQKNHK
jgi:predicted DNA-binding protein (UPF0251 family)